MNNGLIRVGRGELAAAAALHTRAFLEDPYFIHVLRDPCRRPGQLAFLMEVTLHYCFHYGMIFATTGLEAVAAWLPPGSGHDSPWRMIRAGALPALWRIGLPAIQRFLAAESLCDELHARHAPEPHWYLSQLGVEPALQGKGYGHRVLFPTLETIDGQHGSAYLETLNPRAVPFYQKLGFQICEQVRLPAGGPPMWVMRRPPAV